MILEATKFELSGNNWLLHCEGGAFPDVPACVPGNVQADLEAARCLTPLWYGMGDDKLLEVARHDFTYERVFALPDELCGSRLRLCFDGVDYECAVSLDGTPLCSHKGMYERFSCEIPPSLATKGEHRLKVLIKAMPAELEPYITGSDGAHSGEGTEYFFVNGMNKTRQVINGFKSITNFSYDWGTNIYTMGIMKPVYILASGDVALTDVRVKCCPASDYAAASIRVSWTLDALSDCSVLLSGCVKLEGGNVLRLEKQAELTAGVNAITLEGEISNPKLWWPHGQGEQPLYLLDTEVTVSGHQTASDGRTVRFGICSMEWKQPEGFDEDFINPLRLEVNGRTVRTLGSTACSTDLLHGRAHEKGRMLAQRAAELGINTLRMHGGQIIFTEDFYDACDELGILLSVDFPAGNCIVEDEPAIMEAWGAAVRDIVRLLRNHPCIMEWSGGNEMGWQQDSSMPALDLARQICKEEDDRLFRATCPSQGVRHAPWDYNPPIHYKQYNSDTMRDQTSRYPMGRHGEFGCQSGANLEPYKRTIPPASRFPIDLDDPILIRKNVVKAVFFDEGWLMPSLIDAMFGKSDTLENLFKGSYWMSFEGLRYAFDSLRWRKNLGGCTSWCFNEPWPNGAGTFLIDYDGRPVPMAYGVKEALSPISIGLKYDSVLFDIFDGLNAVVMLVSDAPEAANGLSWSYVMRDHRGGIYSQGSGSADIEPVEVKELALVDVAPPLALRGGPVVVELSLADRFGKILSDRAYVFGPKGARPPMRGLLSDAYPDIDFGMPQTLTGLQGAPVKRSVMRCERISYCLKDDEEQVVLRVANEGEMSLLFCEIKPLLQYRPDLSFDRQFFFVPPGDSRDIRVSGKADKALSLLQTGFQVTCLNASDVILPPEGVLMHIGRTDGTCEGFSGFITGASEAKGEFAAREGCVTGDEVPYLVEGILRLTFSAGSEFNESPCRLLLSTADRSLEGASVYVSLGEYSQHVDLPGGYGLQKQTPWHFALPHTLTIDFPDGAIKAGENTLAITIDKGWMTLDSVILY